LILGGNLRRRLQAMRRNTNGASNFFAPAGITEEVLTEPLSGHEVDVESLAGERSLELQKASDRWWPW